MKENTSTDRLDAEERRELKDSDFGMPEIREFPMPDAAHVRAAEAYFRYAPEDKKHELARRILLKAKKYDVDVKSQTILKWAEEWSYEKFERTILEVFFNRYYLISGDCHISEDYSFSGWFFRSFNPLHFVEGTSILSD